VEQNMNKIVERKDLLAKYMNKPLLDKGWMLEMLEEAYEIGRQFGLEQAKQEVPLQIIHYPKGRWKIDAQDYVECMNKIRDRIEKLGKK
jgi:hypothetical protein